MIRFTFQEFVRTLQAIYCIGARGDLIDKLEDFDEDVNS